MNINDVVWVKPTERGWNQIMKHVDASNAHLAKEFPKLRHRMSVPEENSAGYISGQFYVLMAMFDWTNVGPGSDPPFFDLKLSDKDISHAG